MDVPIVETNDWAAGKKIREKTRLPWEKDGGRKNGERDLVGTLVHDGGQEPTSGFAGRGARPSVNPAMHKSGCEENTEPENQSRPAGDLGIRKGEKNKGIAAVVACKGTTTKQRGNCTRKKGKRKEKVMHTKGRRAWKRFRQRVRSQKSPGSLILRLTARAKGMTR